MLHVAHQSTKPSPELLQGEVTPRLGLLLHLWQDDDARLGHKSVVVGGVLVAGLHSAAAGLNTLPLQRPSACGQNQQAIKAASRLTTLP